MIEFLLVEVVLLLAVEVVFVDFVVDVTIIIIIA